MADMEWAPDSMGAEAQSPEAEAAASFKPLAIPRKKSDSVPHDVTAQMTENINASYESATPTQARAAARWYNDAHRHAVHNVIGDEPGVLQSTPGVSRQRRPADVVNRHMMANLRGDTDPADRVAAASPEGVHRESGTLAALSPSSPAGMTWEKNPQASYNLRDVTPEQIEGVRQANVNIHEAQLARGAVKSAKKSGGDVGGAQTASDEAAQRVKASSESSRAPFAGNMLHHAGTMALEKAYDIHHGNITVEAAVPQDVKTGAFQQNINNPGHPANPSSGSQRAVVDGRAHDIAYGHELLWDTERGLGAKSRYAPIEESHQAVALAHNTHPSRVQAQAWTADKEAQMAGQSEGQKAIGQGAKRHGTKPVGQEGMPTAW